MFAFGFIFGLLQARGRSRRGRGQAKIAEVPTVAVEAVSMWNAMACNPAFDW